MTLHPAAPFIPGAHALPDGSATVFAARSRHADAIDLCLFDSPDAPRESRRVRFTHRSGDTWWVTVPGITPGQAYGLRVHGPWNPAQGHHFNGAKLLLDPFARALAGPVDWHPSMQPAVEGDLTRPDQRDSAPHMPRGIVAPPANDFDWQDTRPPATSWNDTVIYELHVRGFTRRHPDVPQELQGTYAGLAHPAVIDYLTDLGVTAVQLLPVHTHLNDGFLLAKDLTNYWGYNTLNFFAPHPTYAAATDPLDQLREFKTMVRAFHQAGIEVILDVVYNHTAEGNAYGPLLSFKGLDTPGWYRLDPKDPTVFIDVTGCGHSVDAYQPYAHQLILASLRYWADEMQVDGFRFDLGTTLGRTYDNFDPQAPFFQSIAQDPTLARCKMIAEPWDIGWGGYQVGGFPQGWHELNGKFRDALRSFWLSTPGSAAESATRMAGSQDLYPYRGPDASLNFLTSHDGFTLRDLVSYNDKHNLANGEDNRDGESHNLSQNFGVEGDTDEHGIIARRLRLQRTLLATVALANGVPFLLAGDERNRTQQGNNNAYCQDNEISWLNWSADPDADDLHATLRRLLRLRREFPALHRQRFFTGRVDPTSNIRDLTWFGADGIRMTHQRWHAPETHAYAAVLAGGDLTLPPALIQPDRPTGSCLLWLLNSGEDPQPFVLPGEADVRWQCLFDSACEQGDPGDSLIAAGRSRHEILDRTFSVWQQCAGDRAAAQCGLPAPHVATPPEPETAEAPENPDPSDPSAPANSPESSTPDPDPDPPAS